jgi:hypothetical protein
MKIVFNAAVSSNPTQIVFIRDQVWFWIVFPLALFWLYQSSQPLSFGVLSRTSRFIDRMGRFWGVGGDWDSEAIWLFACSVTLLDILLQCSLGVIGLIVAHKFSLPAIATIPIALLTTYFVFLWGPAFLTQMRYDLIDDRRRYFKTIAVPLLMLPEILKTLWSYGRGVVRFVIITVLLNAVLIGGGILIFWLIGKIPGEGAHIVRGVVLSVLAATAPILVLIYFLREYLSHLRVSRSVRRTRVLSDSAFLNEMIELNDPLDVTEYVRAVRISRRDASRAISPDFLQGLIRTIENVAVSSDTTRIQVDPSNPTQLVSVENQKLLAWRSDVLDELGRLREFIRER